MYLCLWSLTVHEQEIYCSLNFHSICSKHAHSKHYITGRHSIPLKTLSFSLFKRIRKGWDAHERKEDREGSTKTYSRLSGQWFFTVAGQTCEVQCRRPPERAPEDSIRTKIHTGNGQEAQKQPGAAAAVRMDCKAPAGKQRRRLPGEGAAVGELVGARHRTEDGAVQETGDILPQFP